MTFVATHRDIETGQLVNAKTDSPAWVEITAIDGMVWFMEPDDFNGLYAALPTPDADDYSDLDDGVIHR